jgi:hypothetical protein
LITKGSTRIPRTGWAYREKTSWYWAMFRLSKKEKLQRYAKNGVSDAGNPV